MVHGRYASWRYRCGHVNLKRSPVLRTRFPPSRTPPHKCGCGFPGGIVNKTSNVIHQLRHEHPEEFNVTTADGSGLRVVVNTGYRACIKRETYPARRRGSVHRRYPSAPRRELGLTQYTKYAAYIQHHTILFHVWWCIVVVGVTRQRRWSGKTVSGDRELVARAR